MGTEKCAWAWRTCFTVPWGENGAHLRLRRLRDDRAGESAHGQAEDQARGTAHADLRPAARPGNQRGDEGQTNEPEC